MFTFYYGLENQYPNNRIGNGGGVDNTGAAEISQLTERLVKYNSFDKERYRILSFKRTSPKPGTHYSYAVKVEPMLPLATERDLLLSELMKAEQEMGDKEFKKYQRMLVYGIEDNNPSLLHSIAFDLKNRIKLLEGIKQ